jgi:anti-sigma factor RsiW
MAGAQERSPRQSYARAQLVCREVRQDLVALQRDELSPIRAESVRQHLASCPECREVALDVELAIRSWSALPELAPPPDLADRTVQRATKADGAPGLISEGQPAALAAEKRERSEAPPDSSESPAVMPGLADSREPAISSHDAGERKATKVLPAVVPPPADAEAEPKTNILFRPVRSPIARIGTAAALLIAVLTLTNWTVADALKRAHTRVLGPGFVEAIAQAADAVLTKLRL